MPWFRARDYTLYQGDALGETAGEAVASPSSLAVVIVRVEVEDKSNAKDVAAAQDIFNGISIKGNQSAEFPALILLSGFDEAVEITAKIPLHVPGDWVWIGLTVR